MVSDTSTHSSSRLVRYWYTFIECLKCIFFCCYKVRQQHNIETLHANIENPMIPLTPTRERSLSVSRSSGLTSIVTNIATPTPTPTPTPTDKNSYIHQLNERYQLQSTEIDTMDIPGWTRGGGEFNARATTDQDIVSLKAMYQDDLDRQLHLCITQINNCPEDRIQREYQTCLNSMTALRNARYHLARLTTPEERHKPFYPGRTGFINHDSRQCGYISATQAAFHEGIMDYFLLRPLPDPGQRIDEDVEPEINALQNELREKQRLLILAEESIPKIQRLYNEGRYNAAHDPEEYFNSCMTTVINERNQYQQNIRNINTQIHELMERSNLIADNNLRYRELNRAREQQTYWRNISQDILFNRSHALQFTEGANDYIPTEYQLVRQSFPSDEDGNLINADELLDFLLNSDWRVLAGGGRKNDNSKPLKRTGEDAPTEEAIIDAPSASKNVRRHEPRGHWWTYVRNPDGSIDLINDAVVNEGKNRPKFRNIRALFNHFRQCNWRRKQLYYYE